MKNNDLNFLLKIAKWFVFVVCGILIFYSVVPWQSAGYAIGSAIVSIPFFKLLQQIPLVGLVVSLFTWLLPGVMSILLWGLCQLVEVTPVLLHDPEIYAATLAQVQSNKAPQPSGDKVVDKLQKQISHYLIAIFKNIGIYSAIAYVAEITVNVWYYLPYGNGWGDFLNDFLVWDWQLIKWSDFFLMLGSIGVVELLVLFMLNVHRLFRALTPRAGGRA